MRGFREFCQRGSNSDNIFCCFVFDEGKKDPNSTKIVPKSARQRTLYFVNFQGGGADPRPPPSGSAHDISFLFTCVDLISS